MKKLMPFLLGSIAVLVGTVGCGNATEDTTTLSAEPDTTLPADPNAGQMEGAPDQDPMAGEDPTMGVDGQMMSDTEIESNIRDNLTAQYPDNVFEVDSQDGNVIVTGDVATPEEMDMIRNQIAQMPGVNSVEVESSTGMEGDVEGDSAM